MAESWQVDFETLRIDPVILDLEQVLGDGIQHFSAGDLSDLPWRLPTAQGQVRADTDEIKRIILYCLRHPSDRNQPRLELWGEDTLFAVALFGAQGRIPKGQLKQRRERAAKELKSRRASSAAAVAKRPWKDQPRGGPEWQLLKRMREQILRECPAFRKPAVEVPIAPTRAGRRTANPLREYREALSRHLAATGRIRHLGGDAVRSDADLYIDLPVPVAITAHLTDGQITKWALTQVSDEGELYRSALGEPFGEQWPAALQEVAAELLPEVAADLARGGDVDYGAGAIRPVILAAPQADGIKWNCRPLLSSDILAAHTRVLLVGGPGSGKSTVARNLVRLAAASEKPRVPLYVPLHDFVDKLGLVRDKRGLAIRDIWRYVAEYQLGLDKGVAEPLGALVDEGQAVVVLDGLDEVPTLHRPSDAESIAERLLALTSELCEWDGLQRLLVTARPSAVERWGSVRGLQRYDLARLRGREHEQMAQGFLGSEFGGADARTFVEALRTVPAALKDRPLFIELMASIYARSTGDPGQPALPRRRSDLYRASVTTLLERWSDPQGSSDTLADYLGCSADELYERLATVAYKTHAYDDPTSERDGTKSVPLSLLGEQLIQLEGGPDIWRVLAYLSREAGLLVSPARNEYEFAHRGFQEFLAASYLAAHPDGADLALEHIEADPGVWREPCLMLGEALAAEGRPSVLWDYIDRLVSGDADSSPATGSAIWLASRLLIDETPREEWDGRRNRPIVKATRESIAATLDRAADLGIADRVDLARALDALGDERQGIGVLDGTPEHAWCPVPEGTVQMGASADEIAGLGSMPWAQGWEFEREMPGGDAQCGAFWMSRYPTTVTQFRTFLNAPGGYVNSEWWTAGGYPHGSDRHAHPLLDESIKANLPAIYVGWFDAVAYCAWLTSRLGLLVRLPTEAEWERAARGPEGRVFPWGDDFEEGRCNWSGSTLAHVAPVGILPSGRARWDEDGIHDLAGNVWEWCSTAWEPSATKPVFEYPYSAEDGREAPDLGDDARRVVRGGCFLNGPFLCRASYRGRDYPRARYGRQGFRVVTSRDPASARKESG